MPPAPGASPLPRGPQHSEQSEALLPEEPRLWLKDDQQERQEKIRGGCMEEAISGKESGRSREGGSSGFYPDWEGLNVENSPDIGSV